MCEELKTENCSYCNGARKRNGNPCVVCNGTGKMIVGKNGVKRKPTDDEADMLTNATGLFSEQNNQQQSKDTETQAIVCDAIENQEKEDVKKLALKNYESDFYDAISLIDDSGLQKTKNKALKAIKAAQCAVKLNEVLSSKEVYENIILPLSKISGGFGIVKEQNAPDPTKETLAAVCAQAIMMGLPLFGGMFYCFENKFLISIDGVNFLLKELGVLHQLTISDENKAGNKDTSFESDSSYCYKISGVDEKYNDWQKMRVYVKKSYPSEPWMTTRGKIEREIMKRILEEVTGRHYAVMDDSLIPQQQKTIQSGNPFSKGAKHE